ncbi:winged helix-turn-helix domain-containing protein [Gaoshiqia sp. Z1-71]|uniref:winged helix-turn-helix domain-containing protein n=1 Tax=Gaoshiqia hydrogeniformans TaxID=3290090 RepID=UPI003BF8775B
MIKTDIGINAGRIWQYLDQKGESKLADIKKDLMLKSAEARMALGWLARENKIFFYGDDDDMRIILLY